jgi:hypothetical protein
MDVSSVVTYIGLVCGPVGGVGFRAYSGQEHPSTQAGQRQAGPKDRRNLPYLL